MSRYVLDTESKRRFRYREHRTAHHEAGHAVIGRVLGLECRYVTIVEDGPHAKFRNTGTTVEVNIITTMAGWETERVFGFDNEDDELTEGAARDRSDIGMLCWRSNFTIDIERVRRKTRRLVRKHRACIERVANALLERKTMTAEEVDALMEEDVA